MRGTVDGRHLWLVEDMTRRSLRRLAEAGPARSSTGAELACLAGASLGPGGTWHPTNGRGTLEAMGAVWPPPEQDGTHRI
jgi:hypothetical protein